MEKIKNVPNHQPNHELAINGRSVAKFRNDDYHWPCGNHRAYRDPTKKAPTVGSSKSQKKQISIHFNEYLANWWLTYPLKNMSSSDWIIIPTIGENKSHVPDHQPAWNV